MKITFSALGGYGRLGNQMFQYALLLGVRNKIGAKIVMHPELNRPTSIFDYFSIKECTIEENLISNYFYEKNFSFDPEVYEIKEDTDYKGHFQSEKYFKHCEDIVRNEFTFKEDIIKEVEEFLLPYKDKILVSIHVRRGDYLALPHAHPVCTLEYYKEAIDILREQNTQFICVSEDTVWCKENLVGEDIIYSYSNQIFDMCLISRCHHHIIANSTFSWWGSWLSSNLNKKIIAPKIWFGEMYQERGWITEDIYCDNFIKL